MIDLITGHQGVAHISAEQVATLNNKLTGDYGAHKVVRIKDGAVTTETMGVTIGTGYWRVNGYDMEFTESETYYFDPTSEGLKRIDGVYVEILQDVASGVQRAEIVIVQGTPNATPVAPSAPTEAQYTTDRLIQCELVGEATINVSAATFIDATILFENYGGALFIDSSNYISVDYDKVKREA